MSVNIAGCYCDVITPPPPKMCMQH